jgi:NADPH:quinone reductase
MRAVVVRSYGGPQALTVADMPTPEPQSGQVRVRVEAAAVNPVDLFTRSGGHVQAGMFPAREVTGIGWDFAGVVDAVGADVTDRHPGDRVFGASIGVDRDLGAYAEYVVVGAGSIADAPGNVGAAEAATLPLTGLTALQALDLLDLEKGQTILVTGAAGGVGAVTARLAVLSGLRVVAMARPSDEEYVRGLGVEFFVPAVGDPTADLGPAVRELVPGGVAGAVDAAVVIGGAYDAVKDGGKFVPIVVHGDPAPARGITSTIMWAHDDAAQLAHLAALVESGQLVPRVADVLPFEKAAEAHERMAAGGVRGRLVLVP